MPRFQPEDIDLAEVAAHLRLRCGPSVRGALVGRTDLRDEVVRHLGCSQLEGELVVDTMIGRGFVVRRQLPGEPLEWLIAERRGDP